MMRVALLMRRMGRGFFPRRMAGPACAIVLGCSLAASSVRAESGIVQTNSATAKATEVADLPSAKEIVARFVREIGGKAAFEKIESQHAKGKVDMPGQGMQGDLEVFAKRPDKLLIKISLPGIGEMQQGYDGQVGWLLNPLTGPMLLDGKMLEQVKEQAQFDAVVHDAAEFTAMQTLARTNFAGQLCYQLSLVRRSGQNATEYYDVKTGLLLGCTEKEETPLGPIETTALTSDYRPFGGVLFATETTQKMGPVSQVMKFTSVELNSVPDSVFRRPEAIQGLLQK